MTWLATLLFIGGVIALSVAAVWAIDNVVDAFLDETTRGDS